MGQPVAIVLAKTHQEAMYASTLVDIETEFTTEPILNLDDAYKQKSFLEDPMILEKGNIKKEMSKSNYKLSGNFEIGGQDHFYLETHVAITFPGENDEYVVWSSTQHPTEVQHGIGKVLNIPSAKIDSKVRRLGGGLVEREPGNYFCSYVCLGAYVTQKPVKIRLNRHMI